VSKEPLAKQDVSDQFGLIVEPPGVSWLEGETVDEVVEMDLVTRRDGCVLGRP
jgi:hypothetical protein